MHRLLLLTALVSATAYADQPRMNLAIGGGVDLGSSAGWATRMNETLEMSQHEDGFIYGTLCGYDYWRTTEGTSGFYLPIGGYAGARSKGMFTTLGGGLGVLAIESNRHDDGFGIVPFGVAQLGWQLGTHTVSIDARLSRHVLAGADDFTRWNVLLMIGSVMEH